MEKDWIKIATYTNEITAEMAKSLLVENDIDAVLMNKQDSSLKFGKIELFVHGVDHREAFELVHHFEDDTIDED